MYSVRRSYKRKDRKLKFIYKDCNSGNMIFHSFATSHSIKEIQKLKLWLLCAKRPRRCNNSTQTAVYNYYQDYNNKAVVCTIPAHHPVYLIQHQKIYIISYNATHLRPTTPPSASLVDWICSLHLCYRLVYTVYGRTPSSARPCMFCIYYARAYLRVTFSDVKKLAGQSISDSSGRQQYIVSRL